MNSLAPASAELRALVEQLWPGVLVTTGDVPSGHRMAERYAVVPSFENAQFLVPLVTKRAAAASLLRYNALRPLRKRVIRSVLGTGFLLGVARLAVRDTLTVCAPEDADLLGRHLGRELGMDGLVFGVGVHRLDPNSKPTLQLFTRRGHPAGYAKIGWSPATRELVVNEAESILGLGDLPGVDVPQVIHHGFWQDRAITVTEPLPTRVRGHRSSEPPPLVLAERPEQLALENTEFWKRLRDEAAGIPEDEPIGPALRAALDRIEARHGGDRLPFARWHGDWVPWNLGWHAGRPQVWDWEHSAAEAPVGLDELHWRFQVALVLEGRPLAEAVSAVGPSTLLGRLYLLEMFTRTWRLKRGGGGWNPALYPALIPVLAQIGDAP